MARVTPRLERPTVFVIVGAFGFLVQIAALQALTAGFGMASLPATAVAVELALLQNFVWHERWTWADRARRDPAGVWRRLAAFHVGSGVVSVAGNVAFTAAIVAVTGLPLLLGNALAVGACALANFAVADWFVFKSAGNVEA